MPRRNSKQGKEKQISFDPILAAALARPASSSQSGNGGEARPTSKKAKKRGMLPPKLIEEEEDHGSGKDLTSPPRSAENLNDGLQQIVEGEGIEEVSEAASQTLGEEDTYSSLDDRQKTTVKKGAEQGESSDSGVERIAGKGTKKSFSSLFSNNRLASEGSKLKYFKQEGGRIKITEEDIQEVAFTWEQCLVGYFGGKHPGKQALNHIVNSWKVQVTIQHHGSGWIIFQFSSKEDLATVLENGPYIIYGRPLLLKTMPRYFGFGYEAISCFPVWVQLRHVPYDLWHPNVFGKICSMIGRPIHMDKLTSKKERVTFARCLVEVDLAKELIHSVTMDLPGGVEYEQAIFYENLPRFCPKCRMMGHTKESCKRSNAGTNVEKGKNLEAARPEKGENQNVSSGEGSSKGTEWVVKKTKAGRSQPSRQESKDKTGNKAMEAKQTNKFSPLEGIPETEENEVIQVQENSEANVQAESEAVGQIEQETEGQNVQETVGQIEQETEGQNVQETLGQIELETEAEDQTQAEGPSEERVTKKIVGTSSEIPPKQVGEAIYVQQAKQIASEELRNKLKQTPKDLKGSSGIQRLSAGRPPDKEANTILALPIPTAIGEEGKKRKAKKNQEKGGKSVSFADFCAEMGSDSPNPTPQ